MVDGPRVPIHKVPKHTFTTINTSTLSHMIDAGSPPLTFLVRVPVNHSNFPIANVFGRKGFVLISAVYRPSNARLFRLLLVSYRMSRNEKLAIERIVRNGIRLEQCRSQLINYAFKPEYAMYVHNYK